MDALDESAGGESNARSPEHIQRIVHPHVNSGQTDQDGDGDPDGFEASMSDGENESGGRDVGGM